MASKRRLGVIMDPIATIKPYKDTTLALLLAAARRGMTLHYFEMADLWLEDGRAMGRSRVLEVRDDRQSWFTLGEEQVGPLGELDALLMRKDPPFDMEYIYATYILERAELQGCLVVNRPRSLRDANEKLFTAWFPQCCPPTLVTRNAQRIRDFLAHHGDIILKPLDGMGGSSIFRIGLRDPNIGVIIETLTDHGRQLAMAQRYLPAVVEGDKRVLVVDGEPVPHALARIPAAGETRANLAAGGRGVPVPLGDAERRICAEVGPELVRRGLLFVGLDVIGDRLTEINVTSPTCVREIDAEHGHDIGGLLMAAIERRLPVA